MSGLRVLAGPELTSGAESFADHTQRLGTPPSTGRALVETLVRSGLTGRGGASFPVGLKWRSVIAAKGSPVVIANGAEGEPQSHKDRLLMTTRPHLVLDGAFIAARVLRARRVILYIGERNEKSRDAMLRALHERTEPERGLVTLAAAPGRYVAGAETAAIHFLNEGIATPMTVPPLPFEQGVDRAPTLVQNVETLAHIALIARGGRPTSTLITLAGGVARPGVLEVELGTSIGDAVRQGGGVTEQLKAVLAGGYFGSWMEPSEVWELPLDQRARLGCGVARALPPSAWPPC